jgi:hypothetical protein
MIHYNSDIFKLCNYANHLEYYKTTKHVYSREWISIRNHAILEYASLVIVFYEKVRKNKNYTNMSELDKTLCDRMYAFSKSLNFNYMRIQHSL